MERPPERAPSHEPHPWRDACRVSVNTRYLATVRDHDVIVQEYRNDDCHWKKVSTLTKSNATILDLCASSSLLAISRGSDIEICDAEAKRPSTLLHGLARLVTAISWSSDGQHIAAGSIDGAVCVWSLAQPTQPIARCKLNCSAVKHIAWSRFSDGIIALASDHGLHVWTRTQSPQTVLTFNQMHDRVQHLSWSNHHSWTLLASSLEGRIYVWDLSAVVNQIRSSTTPSKTPLMPVISMISQTKLFREIVFLCWISEQTAGLLYNSGRKFAVVDLRSPNFGSIDWDLGFSHAFEAFALESVEDKPCVRMISRQRQRLYTLPLRNDASEAVVMLDQEVETVNPTSTIPIVTSGRTMSTIPISSSNRLAARDDDGKTNEADTTTSEISDLMTTESQSNAAFLQVSTPALDVPRLVRQESDSPMPFLSPAIPAKRSSWKTGRVSDAISLTEPRADGYFGSFSSATVHDSDSDDDAFDLKKGEDGAQLISGGSSLPLPRSCGAVFNNTGTLVIFRPPSSKPVVTIETPTAEQVDASHQELERTARLFPVFGNLLADVAYFAGPLDLEHSTVEALGLDKASFISQGSWKQHSLPKLSTLPSVMLQHTVQVSIHSIQDSALLEEQLARQYHVLVRAGETGAAMCLANASIAVASGCQTHAIIWQQLAKVVEENGSGDSQHRAVRWVDHPLGSSWLVRRIYEAAEHQGSVQMLACITAVLAGSVKWQRLRTIGNIASRLAIHHQHFEAELHNNRQALRLLPSLKTSFSESHSYQESPRKPRQGSALSSRGPSLPATPRIDSSSSTPPSSFPSLAHSSSRLSLSSSMSPENARGSFSAAVKSYAQSVSDKFASYGTSPPVKKSGPSPSDLPSSMPGASISWTKSVSFASTTTQRSSTLTYSNETEDAYDSDRTIEDADVLSGHQAAAKRLNVIFKNKEAFSQASTGDASRPLIPDDMLWSCRVWVQAYAERLRSWDLNLQAVEFENIGAALVDLDEPPIESSQSQPSAALTNCSICFCIIHGLEQICLVCQHVFHMACLSHVGAHEGTFACPTGCGCTCSLLPGG